MTAGSDSESGVSAGNAAKAARNSTGKSGTNNPERNSTKGRRSGSGHDTTESTLPRESISTRGWRTMPAGDQNKLEAILLCGTEKLIGEDTKIELPLVEQVDGLGLFGGVLDLEVADGDGGSLRPAGEGVELDAEAPVAGIGLEPVGDVTLAAAPQDDVVVLALRCLLYTSDAADEQ